MPRTPGQGKELPAEAKAAARTALSADLLMLLRLALSDEALGMRESKVLRRVAQDAFGIVDLDEEGLFEALDGFGSSANAFQARQVLRGGGRDYGITLARLLHTIAESDVELMRRRDRLDTRIADILDLSLDELKAPADR